MRTSRAGAEWQRVCESVARSLAHGVTDRELLRRFAADRDEAAFAALVRRHAAMALAAGRRVVRVSVSAADVGGERKVPEVAAEVIPIPQVGDTPSLSFTRADGKAGTLADRRGKYSVVHFWASWCGPCKKEMPAVKALHERFAGRGLAVLGGRSTTTPMRGRRRSRS